MAEQRVRILAVIVALLVVLRFGIVPWAHAQNEARDRLSVLTQRLDRSDRVVANREAILAARERLTAQAQAYRARFPTVQTADEFRLVTQQRIGQLAQASGVNLRVFDWILDGDVPDAGVAYGRARITIEGSLRSIVQAHAELEGGMPNAAIREYTMSTRQPAGEPGDVTAEATIVVDIFYRRGTW